MKKCLVIYESFHHGNTKALIDGVEKNLKLKDENFQKIDIQKMPEKLDFDQYEVIILASGVYNAAPSKQLMDFVKEENSAIGEKTVLLLLTGGSNNQKYMKKFEEEIKRYNIEISASYQCRGYDTFGIFKIIGGIAKGHPNDADIAEASDIMKKWLIS